MRKSPPSSPSSPSPKISLKPLSYVKSSITSEYNGLLLDLGLVSGEIIVELGPNPQLRRPDAPTMIWQILNDAQMRFHLKQDIWTIITSGLRVASRLHALETDRILLDALLEYVL
jgi:hypothetical protein